MRPFTYRVAVCGFLFCLATGCSTVGDSLGLSSPANKLLKDAKEIRDTAPATPAISRELSKELLSSHVIQQGDTLVIQPVDLDSPIRLPSDQTVQPDGTIDLGKYGRPVVVGKTVAQLEAFVSDLFKTQEKQPLAITVRLVGRSSDVYYVFGEVNAPGAFPITGRETVLDGIVAAGGVTKKASKENIILARPTPPESCRSVYPVCLPQIVELGDTTTNYQLLPGDRIYVPSKGMLESFFPEKCQKTCPACCKPQSSCFVGGCGQGGYGGGYGFGSSMTNYSQMTVNGMRSSVGNCPGGRCISGNCATGSCPTGNCVGGNCMNGNCQGGTNNFSSTSALPSLPTQPTVPAPGGPEAVPSTPVTTSTESSAPHSAPVVPLIGNPRPANPLAEEPNK